MGDCEALRKLVLGSHDVFEVNEDEHGDMRDVCHKVVVKKNVFLKQTPPSLANQYLDSLLVI